MKVDGCTVEETKKVLIFYLRDEKNNPQGKYPNWYYYWRQTPAAMPFGQNVRLAFHCEEMPIDKCVCLQSGMIGASQVKIGNSYKSRKLNFLRVS